MTEINENQIISNILSKVNNDLDRYLRDINLKDLLDQKNKSIIDSNKIKELEEKNKKLVEEMNNFRKVSLLNTITNQIEEKNKEVLTLKQVIKNRDNTINHLKDRIEYIEDKLDLKNIKSSNMIAIDNFKSSDINLNNDNRLNNQHSLENNKDSYEDNQQPSENNKDSNQDNQQLSENNEDSNPGNQPPLENKIKLIKKKLKGDNYYFENDKLYQINNDLSKGIEVGIYLKDKNKFKFHKNN